MTFEPGVAQAIAFPGGAADIVTCAQSLHDMEPEGALAEIARVLRPGGVFAAYDYDWPPVVHRDAEEAFFAYCPADSRPAERARHQKRDATMGQGRAR